MDDLLSSDEIAALLSGGGDMGDDDGSELSSSDEEKLNQVAEFFADSEKSVVSMLSGKNVEVDRQGTEILNQEDFRKSMPAETPPFIFSATFGGLDDIPLTILIEQNGALTLADIMMGGEGKELPEPSDLYLNAAQEGISQMVGSAFTSISGLLNKRKLVPENIISALGEGEWLALASMTPDTKLWVSPADVKIDGLNAFKMWTALSLEGARNLARAIKEASDANNNPAGSPASMGAPAMNFGGGGASSAPVDVRPAAFQPLGGGGAAGASSPIDMIADIPVRVTVELGKTRKSVSEILALTNGSVIELDKMAGEPVDILVNGKLIARGEVVVIDENFGVRITDIIGVSKPV
ncbi:MAG: flagellar motor switch protein FliN [Synergistaceae bacterium]|nr:flagellar motor switch protein FliN [Synergistaceae bacterium]